MISHCKWNIDIKQEATASLGVKDNQVRQRATAIRELSSVINNTFLLPNYFDVWALFSSKENIPWKNVIAFESDNCSVMEERHKGFIKLKRDKNAKVVDLGCICHLCNLCVKKASKGLPMSVDDLLVDIYYHFDNR